jgi:hypothetical protein
MSFVKVGTAVPSAATAGAAVSVAAAPSAMTAVRQPKDVRIVLIVLI